MGGGFSPMWQDGPSSWCKACKVSYFITRTFVTCMGYITLSSG